MTATWLQIAEQTVAGTAVNNFLDAIYTALTATTYTNGDTRTAGTGRAWTVGAKITSGGTTEALQVTSPAGQKILIAGTTGAKTPKMLSPDTYLTNALHMAISPNGGTLTTWDGAGASDPLGSGAYFSGYTRFSGAISAAGKVCVLEAVEGLAIFVKTSTSWYGFVSGAIFDPGATGVTISETNGYLYGIITSGSTAISGTFASNTGTVFGSVHGGVSGNNHNYYYVPRTATIRNIERLTTVTSALATNSFTLADTSYIFGVIPYKDNTSDNVVGFLRGVRFGPRGLTNTIVLKSATTQYAFRVGGSDTAVQDCYHFLTGL